ncbi:hypothetical protein SDC9_177282 [bioreactor metagenome]|uniref:Uncharacterized protein n=1 Tax=bioreactor metagenome TaxID=1076179 RepID=A0A645GVP5_9ZZZZ
MVFHRGGDDVLALLFICGNRATQSHIIALRPAAGKDDFVRFRADDTCDVFTCGIEQLLCLTRVFMQAGGVSVVRRKRGNHRVHYFFSHHGRCGVVEIYLHTLFLFIDSFEKPRCQTLDQLNF